MYLLFPEYKFKRISPPGAYPARYKASVQYTEGGDFLPLGEVFGEVKAWQTNLEPALMGKTFQTREDVARAMFYEQCEEWEEELMEGLRPLWRAGTRRSGLALTRAVADKVYDVLVQYGAATHNHERDSFYHAHSGDKANHICREYRFCGIFGFGGKFRNDHAAFYADMYPENRTPYLAWLLAQCNVDLRDLYESTYGKEVAA